MFCRVFKISAFLGLGLLMSVCSLAEPLSPLPSFQDNQQNFLEGIVKGQWLKSFTQDTAGSLAIEAGARNYRLDATLGWNLTLAQRVKFTGEYLRQDIDYTFLSGATRQWTQQGALGLDYQYQLTASGLNYVDLSGYYSHAPSLNLNAISGNYFDTQNNLLQYTDFRRIAGSKAYGVSPAVTVNPWKGAQTTLALNYDSVDYDIEYAAHDRFSRGFGGTFTLNQQLSQTVRLNVSAGARTPFNTYQAEIQFTPLGNASVGLIGTYTDGKHDLPNTSFVGIEFIYVFDKSNSACNPRQSANVPLNSWVQKPAVYMPQVLAVADEAFIIGTQPISPDAPPVFLSDIANIEITAGADVNIPTASHFSGEHLVFSATHLAEGLSIDPNTGVISGHTTASSNDIVVTATNASGSVHSNPFNETITPLCQAPAFSGHIPTQLTPVFSDVNVDTAPYFTGTNLTFSATNLAKGLSINPTTGVIGGFSNFSSYNVVVTATNSCGSAQSNVFILL